MMYRLRYRLGRALLIMGLRALPPGRVRAELTQMMDVWTTRVREAIK